MGLETNGIISNTKGEGNSIMKGHSKHYQGQAGFQPKSSNGQVSSCQKLSEVVKIVSSKYFKSRLLGLLQSMSCGARRFGVVKAEPMKHGWGNRSILKRISSSGERNPRKQRSLNQSVSM